MSTDPTALARKVLEREEHLSAYTYSIPLAAQAAWDATRSEQVRAAPTLARAVLELATKVKRVEALANRLDQLAAWERTPPVSTMTVTESPYADGLDEAAARIRAALNGDNK